MKIEEVESIMFGGAHFVRVRCDNGVHGIGQSGCWAYPESVDAVIRIFGPYLQGKDPMRTEHYGQYFHRLASFRGSATSAAISALDIALWDIKGKYLDVPIWQLLGGRYRDRIRLYLIVRGRTADELASSARAAVAEGFTAVKIDPLCPGYQDLAGAELARQVVDCVAAVREAVGNESDVMCELHRKLTPMQFVPIAKELAKFRLAFLEDAVQTDSIASQAALAHRVTTPLAFGERLTSIWEFRELLEQSGGVVCRPDIGLVGGITETKKLCAIAESFHSYVCTHNFQGPLLTAAAAHIDTVIPNFVVQEYSYIDEGPVRAAFPGSLTRDGGYLMLPEAPGLGVELREDVDVTIAPELHLFDQALRSDGSVANAV
jgi:galactonate dehydratase